MKKDRNFDLHLLTFEKVGDGYEANMEMESNSKVSIAERSKLRNLFVQYRRGFPKHVKDDIG